METHNQIRSIKSIGVLLQYTYGILAIAAGTDKFIHILTDWEKYLSPAIAGLLPFSPHTFMVIVGIIEIIAGIVVFIRPVLGGFIVSAWLTLIAFNLLLGTEFHDIAVRDLVMAIGAYSMAKLWKIVKG
ncbi:MAG: hypothetical protein HC906_18350 [Bacteroidales bacterium]|nr:hypothetical protein [Bacteroidales bacterium]